MDSIEFVSHYHDTLTLVEKVVRPEHISSLQTLRESDPHDLIAPEHYFNSEAEAIGIVFQMFLKQVNRDQADKQYADHILSALAEAKNFCIVSAWDIAATVASNSMNHRQLKENFKHLGYWYAELSCQYTNDNQNTLIEEEDTAFIVKDVDLHEAMYLGAKYGQTSIIYHDNDRFEVLDTQVRRVLYKFESQADFRIHLIEVYSNYLLSRNPAFKHISISSLDISKVPSNLESLEQLKQGSELAQTRWVNVISSHI